MLLGHQKLREEKKKKYERDKTDKGNFCYNIDEQFQEINCVEGLELHDAILEQEDRNFPEEFLQNINRTEQILSMSNLINSHNKVET